VVYRRGLYSGVLEGLYSGVREGLYSGVLEGVIQWVMPSFVFLDVSGRFRGRYCGAT